jgi:hypothetical protein
MCEILPDSLIEDFPRKTGDGGEGGGDRRSFMARASLPPAASMHGWRSRLSSRISVANTR